MHRVGLYAALVLGSLTVALQADHDTFSTQEWALIRTLSPLPPLPVDTTNKYAIPRRSAAWTEAVLRAAASPGRSRRNAQLKASSGRIGEKGKIACAGLPHAEYGWLFDIRSNNGGPIPNATALGSLWMTRNVSSIVNTVFYVTPRHPEHTGARTTASRIPSGSTRRASPKGHPCRMGAGCSSRT